MFHEPQIDFGAITDIHKIAKLFSIGIAIGAFKQTANPLTQQLLVEVKSSRRHAAFVRFTWAIDIEITQTHYLVP